MWVTPYALRNTNRRFLSHQNQRAVGPHARYVFLIDVPLLDFEGGPPIKGLNLWTGAEGLGLEPFWRKAWESEDPRKALRRIDRSEIWVLEKNECLLLVDQSSAVRKLMFIRGIWSLELVNLRETFDYIHGRGLALKTHTGIMWALRQLELICRDQPRCQEFAGRTRQLANRLDGFRV